MSLVVIVGQGYVGLPLAMRAAAVGHDVVGFDTDVDRVKRLSAGDSFVEDVASKTLCDALATGRYQPTADEAACQGFDIGVITVPTPLTEGVPDLSFIQSAAATLGRHLQRGSTVILESTTYPGTTLELLIPMLEETSGLAAGMSFHVGYSPERIDPGNRTWTLVNTPKVISGIDAESLGKVKDFYDSVVGSTVAVSRTQEAELVKLIENTFRHVNVALVNEIAMFAADLGINVWEALDAAATKPFGFMRFTPGPGVGGHCLPVDPSYLSWRVKRRAGETFRFVELANDINDHMPRYVVRRLTLALNRLQQSVNGTHVLVLGLAYKANTGDARESPALAVVDNLVALGAEVRAVDPYVESSRIDPKIALVDLSAEELVWADCVVVVTDHDCFDWDLVKERARFVFDTRRRLSGPNVEHL
ncbi:MAG TPA: nucleotide sugar dehydrogenase [Acidimicrobiales bacterium]|nr:nucleotide sugar dehydrogenase [Acidimicrobiales bacterium]